MLDETQSLLLATHERPAKHKRPLKKADESRLIYLQALHTTAQRNSQSSFFPLQLRESVLEPNWCYLHLHQNTMEHHYSNQRQVGGSFLHGNNNFDDMEYLDDHKQLDVQFSRPVTPTLQRQVLF